MGEIGRHSGEDVKQIRKNAKIHVNRIHEIEQETRHDVVAFTRAVAETFGPESKWVHYGLTSTDVVDTALSYLLKQANEILLKDLDRLIEVLKEKAKEHKYTVMMGRTHGVHAEPTTFGLKMALWLEEMKRNRERFVKPWRPCGSEKFPVRSEHMPILIPLWRNMFVKNWG